MIVINDDIRMEYYSVIVLEVSIIKGLLILCANTSALFSMKLAVRQVNITTVYNYRSYTPTLRDKTQGCIRHYAKAQVTLNKANAKKRSLRTRVYVHAIVLCHGFE